MKSYDLLSWTIYALAFMVFLVFLAIVMVPWEAEAREPTRSEARIERMLKREAVRSALAPIMPRASGEERKRLNRETLRRYRNELYKDAHRGYRRSRK